VRKDLRGLKSVLDDEKLFDYDPDQPRDPNGKWAGSGSQPALAGKGGAHPATGIGKHPGAGYSATARVDEHGVIQTSSVYDAQKALAEGRQVELDQPEKVSALIDKLGADSAKMIDQGKSAPNYNLCGVMKEGESLFCHDNKGIPRIKMPQLDKQQTKAFVNSLKDQGYKVEKDNVRSDHLRATQDEISGAKVAAAAQKMLEKSGGEMTKRLVVSRDNYILDGHHHWAAAMGLAYKSGTLKGSDKIKVSRVDISITKLLAAADKFTGGKGRKGTGDNDFWLSDAFAEAGMLDEGDEVMRDKEFSTEKRKTLAKQGKAMKGGSYPIENEADLKNAVQAFGRAKNPAATKAHIKKRASALGLTKLLPESWDAEVGDIKPCPKCDGAGKDEGGLKCTRCDGAGYVADAGAKNEEDDDDNGDDDDDTLEDARRLQLTDDFVIDGVRKTRDGYLVADARIARTGIQLYAGHELGVPDMKVVRVYRPPEEVFSSAAMHSLAHRPITLTHPPEMVDAGNWKEYAVGQTGDEVTRDGDCVRVPMVIMDSKAIEAYEQHGVKELSVGYSTDLKWESGRTPEGKLYDCKQTAIRGNHLAVVPAARGGSRLRIGDWSKGAAEMTRVLIDGQTIEFTDELAAKHVQNHITALHGMAADLQGKLDKSKADEAAEEEQKTRAEKDAASKAGEILALKKQLDDANAKLTGKALDAIVKERTELLLKADAVMNGKADLNGKEPAEIRRIVVEAQLGDAAKGLTEDEVAGAFKAVTANIKPRSGVDRLTDSLSLLNLGGGNRTDPKAIKDAAYEEYVKNLTNAWRPRAAS
jgi:uncharacterized protein